MEFVLVGAGGAIGSVARYAVAVLYRHWAIHSVLATLTVNMLGCFLIGLLAPLHQNTENPHRFFWTIGLLGGFTTFSSFTFETFDLYSQGTISKSLTYLLASNIICLVGFGAGYFLANRVR